MKPRVSGGSKKPRVPSGSGKRGSNNTPSPAPSGADGPSAWETQVKSNPAGTDGNKNSTTTVTGENNWYGNTRGTSKTPGTFWIFRPGGGGWVHGSGNKRHPGPRTSNGYAGVSVHNQEAAKRAWFDGTLSAADQQWWEDHLSEIRAKVVSPAFHGKWTAQSAWNKAVEAAGDTGLTPQEWGLSMLGRFDANSVPPINRPDSSNDDSSNGGGGRRGSNGGGGGSGGSGGGGGGGGGGSQTRNDISYNFTDPLTAKNLVTGTLTNFLGREPTSKELSDLTAALRAAEQANPSISTSTASSPDGGTTVNQTSSTSGGLDSAGKQQVLLDQLEPTAEYQAVQTDSVFRKALGVLAGGGF